MFVSLAWTEKPVTGERLETETGTRGLRQSGAATHPPDPAPVTLRYNVTQCHDLLQINKKLISSRQSATEMFTECLPLPESCLKVWIYLKFSVFQMFGLLSRSEKFRESH